MTGENLIRAGLVLGALTIGALVVSSVAFSYHLNKGTAAEGVANEDREQAKAWKKIADDAVPARKKAEDRANDLESQAATLRRERDDLRARLAGTSRPRPSSVPAPVDPSAPSPDLPVPLDDRDALIEKDAELIDLQEKEIGALKVANSGLHAETDALRKALAASEAGAQAQAQATAAWKSAVAAAEWKTGIKGALAGAALGFIAGRTSR